MQLPNPRNGTNETHKSDLVAGNGPAAAHNCTFARHVQRLLCPRTYNYGWVLVIYGTNLNLSLVHLNFIYKLLTIFSTIFHF